MKHLTRIMAILFFTFTLIMLITELQGKFRDPITLGYSVVALWMSVAAYFNNKKLPIDNREMVI